MFTLRIQCRKYCILIIYRYDNTCTLTNFNYSVLNHINRDIEKKKEKFKTVSINPYEKFSTNLINPLRIIIQFTRVT